MRVMEAPSVPHTSSAPVPSAAESNANTSTGGNGSKKKKAGKPKSRNDFSDVQRIELDSVLPTTTTLDILASAQDMDDLSKKLEDRLQLHPAAGNLSNGVGVERPDVTAKETRTKGAEEPTAGDSSNLNIIYCSPQNTEVHVVEDSSSSLSSGIDPGSSPTTSDPAITTSSLDGSSSTSTTTSATEPVKIEYRKYESELQMPDIIRLIQKDLSEPYSIYTYRYFIHNWPQLCFLAMHGELCVGAIVCKLGMYRQIMKRGYIAMLAVDKEYRKLKIGTNLVQKAIEAMLKEQADEVVLETEITNTPALRLYENLGFVRDKRLFHYYLNGVDALRLKLWFR